MKKLLTYGCHGVACVPYALGMGAGSASYLNRFSYRGFSHQGTYMGVWSDAVHTWSVAKIFFASLATYAAQATLLVTYSIIKLYPSSKALSSASGGYPAGWAVAPVLLPTNAILSNTQTSENPVSGFMPVAVFSKPQWG
ncbi:hypothetical protein [Emticicia sp. 21SJ11W-3]|uniref:hypothetical protein n=1 Tax=Emticicia sp. 21SJ11W-3 TaxID=2916755 RepID=UPI0020A1077C|nr:hypothetical protein [Emticicia sp. 21SJ11W-3]UTA66815.1 hypothetical protein MB380_14510 [Emticicia sp. 21SJ11W-3]